MSPGHGAGYSGAHVFPNTQEEVEGHRRNRSGRGRDVKTVFMYEILKQNLKVGLERQLSN